MFVRTLLTSTALAATMALAAPAFAGECPAGQMRADATKPVNFGPNANSCKDGIIEKVRAGRRPAPGMTAAAGRPVISHS